MRIGVLGTGMVGQAIAARLAGLGHEVMMGSREANNPKALDFAAASGARAGSFGQAADFAEIVFNCTNGANALSALQLAGADNLRGKVLADLSNPLDFSRGFPPFLSVCNTDSLAETIQRAFPETCVVKTLCTVNADIMVEPRRLSGNHHVYLSGNDEAAKEAIRALLVEFGWRKVIDLGGIETARGQEMMMPLWLSLWKGLGTAQFNFTLVTDEGNDGDQGLT
ncbi:NADPH-dependent F420 reductase [Pelagibacterium limicola]|uniref:NADPH-dependent F420 reductase n=1 Tax=Pelagibacterium limicola TaxID=2791022 RepID=UPI0018AFA13F|nr:NAD(P)-binding domain-containing protein [Pelagibacterium limicola]